MSEATQRTSAGALARPWALVLALVGLLAVTPATPPALADPAAATGCQVRATPPPAVDASEVPRPGQLAPGPLSVPASPVGGPRMGECGDVLPPGAPPPPPGGSAASWVLADLDTGVVLAARDPHDRHRPASTLKVLTALVTIRRLSLDTVVEGTQQDADVDGSRVGIGPGGRYTVRQLLTGLIMNSGNDAANALARQQGGVPATLAAMSTTAGELGALDTRPATPSGLDGPGMSTSAYDLALIYRVAMREPTFAEINRIRMFTWPGYGTKPGFDIRTDNRLLASYPGAIGGKTGFTDDARHTLIAAAERGGRRLVVVLLRGEQRPVPIYLQAERLLDYGFALPSDSPPVGNLVDSRPAAPVDPAAAMDPAGGDSAAGSTEMRRFAASDTAEAEPGNRSAGLATIGGGALLGALLSVLIVRRRSRGKHLVGVARQPCHDPRGEHPTERIEAVPGCAQPSADDPPTCPIPIRPDRADPEVLIGPAAPPLSPRRWRPTR